MKYSRNISVEEVGSDGSRRDVRWREEGNDGKLHGRRRRFSDITSALVFAADLKKKGVEFTREPTTMRPGVRVCFIRAPEGVSIELLDRSGK